MSPHHRVVNVHHQRGPKITGKIVGIDIKKSQIPKATTAGYRGEPDEPTTWIRRLEHRSTDQSSMSVSDTPCVLTPPGGLTYKEGRRAKRCLFREIEECRLRRLPIEDPIPW